jgi:hypothetical protein
VNLAVDLVLSSCAQHGVSKDGHEPQHIAAILRDAALSRGPQDEVREEDLFPRGAVALRVGETVHAADPLHGDDRALDGLKQRE